MNTLTLLRRLVGIRLPPVFPPSSRRTEEAVLSMAEGACEGIPTPLVVDDLAMQEGKFSCNVRTATMGSGWVVPIDDADGSVIEAKHWGVR